MRLGLLLLLAFSCSAHARQLVQHEPQPALSAVVGGPGGLAENEEQQACRTQGCFPESGAAGSTSSIGGSQPRHIPAPGGTVGHSFWQDSSRYCSLDALWRTSAATRPSSLRSSNVGAATAAVVSNSSSSSSRAAAPAPAAGADQRQGKGVGSDEPLGEAHRHPHKPLLPMDGRDWAALSIVAVALFVAAGGGLGGGGILVPVFLVVLDFSSTGAVALSNITICGGALANVLVNVGRRHPFKPRESLVYWDLILVMEPGTILGALVGGYINKVTPGWLTTSLLTVVLAYMSHKLLARALATYRAEDVARQHALRQLAQPLMGEPDGALGGEPDPALDDESCAALDGGDLAEPAAAAEEEVGLAGKGGSGDGSGSSGRSSSGGGSSGSSSSGGAGLQQLLLPARDQQQQWSGGAVVGLGGNAPAKGGSFPVVIAAGIGPSYKPPVAALDAVEVGTARVALDAKQPAEHWGQQQQLQEGRLKRWHRRFPLAKVLVLLVLFAAVVASDMLKDRQPCGSLVYWATALSIVPLVAAVAAAVGTHLIRQHARREAGGYAWAQGDVRWTHRSTALYSSVCSLAGLFAGMFGVGGGIVKGPLMLEMGVLPDVAAATSSTMIMFTAASAAVVYATFGSIAWDYGTALACVGFGVTLAGQLVVHRLMKTLKRRSVIVFAMAAMLILSAAAVGGQAAYAVFEAARGHTLGLWGHICHVPALRKRLMSH